MSGALKIIQNLIENGFKMIDNYQQRCEYENGAEICKFDHVMSRNSEGAR